jgi:hypothetical protein
MARSRRSGGNKYTTKNYYRIRSTTMPGATVRIRTEPTVGGAVILCVASIALLFALVIGVGPLIDFFSIYLMEQAGNPYAAPVIDLLSWCYVLILLGAGVAFVLVWRVVIRSIWQELRDEM